MGEPPQYSNSALYCQYPLIYAVEAYYFWSQLIKSGTCNRVPGDARVVAENWGNIVMEV